MSMFTRINKGLIAIAAALQLAVGLAAGPAHGASFDCAKAKSVMEKTVCADPKLSKLDEEMATAYAGAKVELKDRPKELKKLIASQREWLSGLNPRKSPCATKPDCLTNSYQTRIKELHNVSAFARATSPTAVGPTQEEIIQLLNKQLEQLKTLVRSAKKIQIDAPLNRSQTPVCKEVWKKLPQATVPVPTEFANTSQQKWALFEKVRQMAYDNQKLYFAQGKTVKDMSKYKKRFDLFWGISSNELELDARRNSVYMIFARPDTSAGFKHPIAVQILPDLKRDSLTLGTTELSPDGLRANSSIYAYSIEFYEVNDIGEKDPMPYSDYAGILSIGNEAMSWKLVDHGLGNKFLTFVPTQHFQDGQHYFCNFEFNINK
ncbi:MAG: DUF1311 domain-containing protein [Geobacter sp.]|nr:DUF1311 domain-containing protein [Geobacter sp.]